MADEQLQNDPFRPGLKDDEFRRAARLDNEMQPDPELSEGPASNGKIALLAIAIAVILGAVFYGLNNSTVNQASTAPPAQTAQTQPASPGNSGNGATTGSATTRPTEPQATPKGTEVDRSGNSSAPAK